MASKDDASSYTLNFSAMTEVVKDAAEKGMTEEEVRKMAEQIINKAFRGR